MKDCMLFTMVYRLMGDINIGIWSFWIRGSCPYFCGGYFCGGLVIDY